MVTTEFIFRDLMKETIVIEFWKHLLSSTSTRPIYLRKKGNLTEKFLRKTFYSIVLKNVRQ